MHSNNRHYTAVVILSISGIPGIRTSRPGPMAERASCGMDDSVLSEALLLNRGALPSSPSKNDYRRNYVAKKLPGMDKNPRPRLGRTKKHTCAQGIFNIRLKNSDLNITHYGVAVTPFSRKVLAAPVSCTYNSTDLRESPQAHRPPTPHCCSI